ncbi:MAG: hypothetical protein M3264_14075, partial [Thermoproteota archaeon]|nr:hypothetical protein [Thermoproteota archaeon]
HMTMGEPLSYDTMQYYKDRNPQNLRFPFAYFHHAASSSSSFLTRKEKSHKNFSDFLEDQILQPLRKVVEYKNLVSQLFTIPQQQRIMPGPSVYSRPPFMTFERGKSNNNLAEHSEFEDNNDYSETIGYRGHVCKNCLTINIDTIFRRNDREHEQIKTKHMCNPELLADAQLEPDKDKIITDQHKKLSEIMKKNVNTWTKNSAYLVAIEIPSNAAVNNCFEITPNDENHWATRTIKNKQTILNDEEIADFLCKARNATCAYFKVASPYPQQQKQESSTHYYLMMITDSKIKDSFG